MSAMRQVGWCAAMAVLLALVAGAAPTTGPAASDDVMRPTQRNVRMTPAIARAMTHWWMQKEIWRELDLSEQQEEQVQELLARKFMETARSLGEAAQPLVEYEMEVIIETQGLRRPPRDIKAVGQRLAPLVQMDRDVLDSLPQSVAAVLSPEQRAKLEATVQVQKQALDRVEGRLKLMAEGHEQTDWNVFKDIDDFFGETSGSMQKGNQAMRQARRNAERELEQYGKGYWKQFLEQTIATFKFDESQQARGRELLATYLKRADAIQTPEFKARLRYCLTWSNAAGTLGDTPKRPWEYRLQRMTQELVKPLDELWFKYQDEVLALATTQQWTDAAAELRRLAGDNGMPPDERPDEPLSLLAPELQAGHN